MNLQRIWLCETCNRTYSWINVYCIIKIVNRINSPFIDYIKNYNWCCWSTKTNTTLTSRSYTNIGKILKTCWMNYAVNRGRKFIPSYWTLNRVWEILIIIIIRSYLIVFTNLTNIITPTKFYSWGIIYYKLSPLSINISYFCNYTTDNTFNDITFLEWISSSIFDVIISYERNKCIFRTESITITIDKQSFILGERSSLLFNGNSWIDIFIDESCISWLICLCNTCIGCKTNTSIIYKLECESCWTGVCKLGYFE